MFNHIFSNTSSFSPMRQPNIFARSLDIIIGYWDFQGELLRCENLSGEDATL